MDKSHAKIFGADKIENRKMSICIHKTTLVLRLFRMYACATENQLHIALASADHVHLFHSTMYVN